MAERTELVTSEAISLRMIEYGVELARDVGATALLIIEACIGSGTNNVDFAHFTSISGIYRSITITGFNRDLMGHRTLNPQIPESPNPSFYPFSNSP